MAESTKYPAQTDGQGAYSALTKRPAPKIVDPEDSAVSYVAGVRLVDDMAQRRDRFKGWEKDDNALLVVRSLEQGDTDKFACADLHGVNFSGAPLASVNLQNADLKNADLSGADLRGADLRGADLRGVNLEEADLSGALLDGARLDGAYLKNAKIAGARLAKKALNELEIMQQMQRDAEEGKLDLRKANLRYLDLRRLDLRGLDLTGVDLSGVNLVGVNLTGCKVDPMYLDGTYAFRQGAGRKIEIKKGNYAGLDLTTANQMKAKAGLTELEALRRKRVAAADEEQQRIDEINRATERMRREEEAAIQTARAEQSRPRDAVFSGSASSPTAGNESADGLSKELALLKSRRQNQASPEELKARLQDVVLEKRPLLKSGARSLVTRRPRRKEELPPGKYDFPILYPVDDDEKKKEKKSPVAEVVRVAEQVTDCVRRVFQKVVPRRSNVRVKRSRQRFRS